jgi:hypothetical protein
MWISKKEFTKMREEINELKKAHQFLLERTEAVIKADKELLSIVKNLKDTMEESVNSQNTDFTKKMSKRR